MSRHAPSTSPPAGFAVEARPSELALRFWAPTLDEALRQAAHGLESLLAGTSQLSPARQVSFTLSGTDNAELVLKLLNELLFYFDLERLLFDRIELARTDRRAWQVRVSGEPFDPARHASGCYVKAVVASACSLGWDGDRWRGGVALEL